jgi:DUF3047 family protein
MALSRKTVFVLFTSFFLCALLPLPLGAEQLETPSQLAVDGLSANTAPGEFPPWWKTYPFQKGKAKAVYKVQEENGNRFIRAQDDKDISTPIFKDFGWSLQNYPVLQWNWRAIQMPQGAREDNRATNDSACGVYVAFGRWSGVALKYVWSSTLPAGHVWEKEPGKFYIIVLASGPSRLNQWKSEKVNVVEDFKKYFKKDPSKNPSGIGIMTDGNATHTPAACDYTDFTISKS